MKFEAAYIAACIHGSKEQTENVPLETYNLIASCPVVSAHLIFWVNTVCKLRPGVPLSSTCTDDFIHDDDLLCQRSMFECFCFFCLKKCAFFKLVVPGIQ